MSCRLLCRRPKLLQNRLAQNLAVLIVGGLLVGIGTRLGNGRTSGHGVCGMSRLAPRSLIATVTFMAAGFLTVAITHLAGLGQ